MSTTETGSTSGPNPRAIGDIIIVDFDFILCNIDDHEPDEMENSLPYSFSLFPQGYLKFSSSKFSLH